MLWCFNKQEVSTDRQYDVRQLPERTISPENHQLMYKLILPCLLAFGLMACDGNEATADDNEVTVEYPTNGVPAEIQAAFAADHPNATDVE